MTDFLNFVFHSLLDLLFKTDQFLSQVSVQLGAGMYVLIFLIIFCETGLVVTPFLPGDSLLFALGAMTTLTEGALRIDLLSALILVACFLGDNVNYFLGKHLGLKVFSKEDSKFFNKKYLYQAQDFYSKRGVAAIIIARFIPIVRTFVPFVAGVGHMNYKKFLAYSFIGAVLWSQIFLWAGRIFGNLPAIKTNFHLVIFGVIGLSVLPIVIGFVRVKFFKSKTTQSL